MDKKNNSNEILVQDDNVAVYPASYVQKSLLLSKSKTYEYLREVNKKQSPFRVIKIGATFRIPKKEFDEWLYGKDDANA